MPGSMRFQFEDTEGKVYRADIPEGSDHYSKFYNVQLGACTAFKNHQDLYILGVSVKQGTVEIDISSTFKIEIRDKHTAYVEKLQQAFGPEAPARNPNAKIYKLKNRPDWNEKNEKD